MKNKLPNIHALWIGEYLGPISRACLRSFVMRGHTVYLHTYGEIKDLPEGVKIKDANRIVDQSKIIKHRRTGSYALFSDIFRYELLKQTDNNNVYVDCDVYCLRPVSIPENGYLLGYEDDNYINGAVLAIPDNSPLLGALLQAAYDPMFIPPWFSEKKKLKLKLKKRFGFGKGIENMPWGIIGPTAITYYVEKLKIKKVVQPMDIFYPVHYLQIIGCLTDPSLCLDDLVTHRTDCVHLYNEMLRKIDLSMIDKGSTLAKLLNNEI